MAKLTKTQLSSHKEAEALLRKKRDLDYDEVIFVLTNWLPDSHSKTSGAAFFTPLHIAHWVSVEAGDSGHILDLCAGIGHLTYFQARKMMAMTNKIHLTAIEINPDFIRVGRKLVPQADWIEGDIFDLSLWRKLRLNAWMWISNPPFGTGERSNWLSYTDNMSLAACEVGLRVTTNGAGVAVLPQSLLPFKYSARRNYEICEPTRPGQKWLNLWPDYSMGCSSLDTSIPDENYPGGFSDTNVIVEVVNFEFPFWDKEKPGLEEK